MENTRKYYLFTDTQLEIINSRMISNRAGLCLDHVHDLTTRSAGTSALNATIWVLAREKRASYQFLGVGMSAIQPSYPKSL